MNFHVTKKSPSCLSRLFILAVIILLLISGVVVGATWWTRQSGQKSFDVAHDELAVLSTDSKKLLKVNEEVDIIDFAFELLGRNEPHTYLMLFLNNTEYRPGGGFIGSYAVVKANGEVPEIVLVEGTELLDGRAVQTLPNPPAPLNKYLGVNSWFFRDSNWSPDFPTSAAQSLAMYTLQGGELANEIDIVVAITPTVLDKLLEVVGPITVDGITFSPGEATETLEYDVEYGFLDRGIKRENRKDIIGSFASELMKRVGKNMFFEMPKYMTLIQSLIAEKHIMAYSPDTSLEETFFSLGVSGEVARTDGDYISWVDANLGALKTDYAINRLLDYSIVSTSEGLVAEATMLYEHTGSFDWRTTRYLSYARAYVPAGSKLISARVQDNILGTKEISLDQVDQGEELGKNWFGTFVKIEPGRKQSMTFKYILPERVKASVTNGEYTLLTQKQLGAENQSLTLLLDFGTNIVQAAPEEAESQWYDTIYRYSSDFKRDKQFLVSF